MDLKPNSFYVKKALSSSIPLISEFPDLPLSGSSSTNNTFFAGDTTLSTGDVRSFNILSGNTSSNLNYGDYKLQGGYLKYFTENADTGISYDPLSVKLWSVKSDYAIEQGGFTLAQSGTTGTAMGHNIAAYYTRPISAIPNMVEDFEDRQATLTKTGTYMFSGPYVDLAEFIDANSGSVNLIITSISYKKDAYLRQLALANAVYFRGRHIVPLIKRTAKSGRWWYQIAKLSYSVDGSLSTLSYAGTSGDWERIYVGSKFWGGKDRYQHQHADLSGLNIQYADVISSTAEGSDEGIQPMMGGLMSAYMMTKNIQNPYSADLANAMIYSNVQIQGNIGSGPNGNALRIYHEWDYSDTNRTVETENFGTDTGITPQVFRLGCYNLPVPLVTDASADRPGDRRSCLPYIDITMNIKQLSPTPLYAETTNMANYGGGASNDKFTLYPVGTNSTDISDYFFSGNSTTPGANDYFTKDRSESFLRSVAVVFSNYKPLSTHTTLDAFLDYGLSNFYGNVYPSYAGVDDQGVVGGVVFRSFGMKNGTDGITSAVDPTVPPGFDAGKIYAQAIPVTYNTNITRDVNFASSTDPSNSMLVYASGGLAGFQPDAVVGTSVTSRRPVVSGSKNVLATVGTRNIMNNTAILAGPAPTFCMKTVALPTNTFFDMRFYIDMLTSGSSYTNSINPYSFWPYTGSTAWPMGGNSAGNAAVPGGSSMRVTFDAKDANAKMIDAPASVDSNIDIPYLDIPFSNTKNSSYSFSDLDGSSSPNYLLYPKYMTIWVQNYRWIRGQQNAGRPGSADELFYFGDAVASGSSVIAEVLIDSMSLHNFYPEQGIENMTATNPTEGGWNITNQTVLSPFDTIEKVGYKGSGFQGAGEGYATGYPSAMDNIKVSPGGYLSLGFDNKANFPIVGTNIRGGYLFFSDYYSENPVEHQRINPTTDMLGIGANMSVLNTLSGSSYENLQVMGSQFRGDYVVDTSTAASGRIDPIAAGPSRFTVDNLTATDNALSLASGTYNTNMSVDGFTQKGFARLHVTGASTAGEATYGTWGKRENVLACTKVIGFSDIDSTLNLNQIRVANPQIFNAESTEEEYIIFQAYRDGLLSTARYAKSGLKISSVNGDIITFSTNCNTANSGVADPVGPLMTEATLSELYVSPYKYWVTLMFKGDQSIVSRGYGQVAMVNETPAVSNITNLTGTTWNESNFSYHPTLTGAADAGDSSPYQRRWDLTNIKESSIIERDADFGHGKYDPDTKVGGYVASEMVVSGSYSEFNIGKFVTNSVVGENNSFTLISHLENPSNNSQVQLVGMDNTTKTNYQYYTPKFYYQFKDELPTTPLLNIKPAVDLLKEGTDLYNITSENMNAVKFEWEEADDDIWYRYLICSTGSINNKYQHARLWMPLNEEPPNQQPDNITLGHTCYNVVSGTTLAMTNGGKVPSDINGLSGFAPYFKTGTGAYLYLPIGTSGFDFPFTSNGSDSVTEFSVVLHCTPDEDLSESKYTILHKGGLDNLNALTVLISGADSNAPCVKVGINGTYLTSSPITLDGSPVNIIYTYKKDSEFGPDAQLYVNGSREDYATTMPTLPTTDVRMEIGGNNNTRHFKGQIEEIIFYDVELKVPDSATDYIYSTANVSDKNTDGLITHTAKLFLFDYHNIRGRSFKEVTSSNQVSWRATTL